MRKVETIIENASELLTLAGYNGPHVGPQMSDLGIITGGSVAIDSVGKIAGVGTSRSVSEEFRAERTIDAAGRVVMPGFVDPHTHSIYAGSREFELEMKIRGATFIEILEKGGGILRTVRDTRNASEDELVSNALRVLNSMLLSGTTSVEMKSGYGLTTESELKILRVISKLKGKTSMGIASTLLGAHAIPEEYSGKTPEYTNLLIEEMIPACSGLADFCDVPCEKGFFDPEQSRRILEAGKKYGMLPKLHADEFAPSGGARVAAEVDAVSSDHMIFSPWNEVELFKGKRTIAVLLPDASFTLFMKDYANARRMIDGGIPIALGTDFSPGCRNTSQQITCSLALYTLRMTPSECITAATINAAHAINRQREVGSIEVGKRADVIILDAPKHDFVGYEFGRNVVSDVFVCGRHMVEDGRLVRNAPYQAPP